MTGSKIQNLIEKTDLWKLIRIVPLIFALHELEEWRILAWHRRYQSNIPDVTDLDLQTIFLFLIAVVFIVFFIAQRIKNRKIAVYILFPILLFMVYNGLVHLWWTMYFSTYAPGLIFGFVAGVPFFGIIIYKMISEKLVSKWYASLFGVLFTAMLVNAIIIGDRIESGLVHAMLLGKFLAGWIWY